MILFSDEEFYYAVKKSLPQVSEYISSHRGGITLEHKVDGMLKDTGLEKTSFISKRLDSTVNEAGYLNLNRFYHYFKL